MIAILKAVGLIAATLLFLVILAVFVAFAIGWVLFNILYEMIVKPPYERQQDEG